MLLGEGKNGSGAPNAKKVLVFSYLCDATGIKLRSTVGVKFSDMEWLGNRWCKEEIQVCVMLNFQEQINSW